MKKIVISILVLMTILILVIGCGGPSNDVDSDTHPQRGSDIDHNDGSVDQKLVNFKCVIADVQKYYFLENKIKVESPGAEGWLVDDMYYVKVDIQGKQYLMTGGSDESEITVDEMLNMYKMSKTAPNFECTLGGVTEDKVTLPDLEIIDQEEMTEKMMQGMGMPQ